jgi:hypothetical protein
MEVLETRVEDGKYTVAARIVPCGRDLCVTVTGGTRPHIGASALAVPRPSLSDPARTSSTVSVLCVTGHREDDFVRAAAGQLSARCNCVVTVTAGIHIDRATPEDLARLNRNLEALLQEITHHIDQNRPSG